MSPIARCLGALLVLGAAADAAGQALWDERNWRPCIAPLTARMMVECLAPPIARAPVHARELRLVDFGTAMVLHVDFETGRDRLDPSAQATVDELARALADPRLAAYRIRIEGHADASGAAPANLRISAQRAAAVRQQLIERGIAVERIEAEGLGATRPLDATRPTDPINRRIEIRRLPN